MNKKRVKFYWIVFPLILLGIPCTAQITRGSLQQTVSDVENITGRSEYISSPFVTAGDRLYMVGHQDGQFPDLGWHVAGEMGGIWDHPIKLMDGFTATIKANEQSFCLTEADTFINYPFANLHIYRSALDGIKVERFQFVPDGKEAIVIEFTFINERNEARDITFEFNGYTDLRPVWLGERTGMKDAGDYAFWDGPTESWIAKDSINNWHVMFGSAIPPIDHRRGNESCNYRPIGKGDNASLSFAVEIPPNASLSIPITIAGSYHSLGDLKETYEYVQKNAARLLKDKKERYESIAQKARLTIPDKELQQAFRWLKYNTDWLVRDVPETGRGISAGIPDYPWWFGVDSEYALQGAIVVGQVDIVYSTIDLLHQISEKSNGNGRIVHEVSTNGAVFNPGNINETPQFVSLIWKVYQWTGDKEFLKKYYPVIQKGLEWLFTENDADGNLLPDGFGMMEIHGMDSEMIDVAVYTQKALADAVEIALELEDKPLSEKYRNMADKLALKINTEFWVPEYNSYADFIGTTQQALRLIDDAIVRADTLNKPWAVKELQATKDKITSSPDQGKQGFVVHHNWVVNTPMEIGIADTAKALAALETGNRFVNPFGVFVTGIDRDETAGNDESSFAEDMKTFSYTGAVMTLPTGVQAIAENNYGRPDRALEYLQRMTRSFSFALPGSMYEVSPDFGMMTQAWNIYSYAVPIVEQFFGIQPMASEKTIRVRPQMPSSWADATIENVIIGDNELSMEYNRTSNALKVTIGQSREDWKVVFAFPKGKYQHWQWNGKEVKPETDGKFDILEMDGDKISLTLME